ncbi:cupin domain-containing protein [Novosphingobium sp. 1949]|uniref:Cupin domain-containing protein n=1 Tax=Novosphingobium organovorum TaxID=2930092 RepID=A0ABT0BHG9_9SPHN|nr:cupin domain-containing protein [Novosphingobium organovorum]MCJ2184246.1 cupin domain-containing protein [Novosphingobium organovorum]
MDYEVGRRLRFVRERKQLSQRTLARLAGVPSSTISLIESGRTNPSVGSLKRIVSAIGISLGEFFSLETPREERFYYRSDELVEIGKGGVSYRQLGSAGESSIQMLYEVYQAGAESGRVMLSHEGEEAGVIIAGRLEVTVAGESQVLEAGDAYLFSSLKPHRFRNVGKEKCVVVSACTPPSF